MYENIASRINFISIEEFNQPVQPIYVPFCWRQMRHIEGFIRKFNRWMRAASFPQLSIKIHVEIKNFYVCYSPHPLIKLHWNLKNSTSFTHWMNVPGLCNRLKGTFKHTLKLLTEIAEKFKSFASHATRFALLIFFLAKWKFFRVFIRWRIWITSEMNWKFCHSSQLVA